MSKKLTNEEFLQRVYSITPTIKVMSPYNGKEEKVSATCEKCGYSWEVRAASLMKGYGCPQCAGNAPKTTEQFAAELLGKTDKIIIIGTYTGANNPIAVRCRDCGKEWSPTPSKLLNGRGCPECSKQIVTRKRIQAFIEKDGSLANNYNDLLGEWNYEENKKRGLDPNKLTSSSNESASWQCSKCGFVYDAMISNRTSRKSGCPVCCGKITLKGFNDLTTVAENLLSEWDYEANAADGIYPEEQTKGSSVSAHWKCSVCGRKWTARIYSRIRGTGCPFCAQELQSSFPEKVLYYYLKQAFPDAVSTYKADWLLQSEIDIFLPSLQFGVEYDGEGYHQNPQKDENKDKLCAEHGIKILHVREPKCPPLSPAAIVYSRPNKKEEQLGIMVAAVIDIINAHCGTAVKIAPCISKDKPQILEIFLSKRKDNSIASIPDAMLDWDWEKNKGIDPNKVARGSETKVWWKCHICGNSSQTRVVKHQGHKCSVCKNVSPDSPYYETIIKTGKKDLLTLCPELCKDWLPELNNGLRPENFSYKSSQPIIWKCATCGHIWRNAIYNRANGQRCPVCWRKTPRAHKSEKHPPR